MNHAHSVVFLMQQIVLPALAAVLREHEIDSLVLEAKPPADVPHVHEVPGVYWLSVSAVEERFSLSIDTEIVERLGVNAVRDHLQDQLSTFVAESKFGWGQQR